MATEAACGCGWRVQLLPDGELVTRARRGCQPAAEELVRRYRGLVEAVAKLFFLPGAEAEDVLQEGMIGLVKAIRDFSDGRSASFRSFAELCVTRHIISAVKAARRQKHTLLTSAARMPWREVGVGSGPAEMPEPVAPPGFSPECVVQFACLLAALRECMEVELSCLERTVLDGYLAGWSYRQIARRLGCGWKRVDNALQRAKKKVAKRLVEVL